MRYVFNVIASVGRQNEVYRPIKILKSYRPTVFFNVIAAELMQSEPKSCPQKPKWEITKITISQNTKRTYGKPNEQLSSFSYLNLTEYLNTQKVKTVQKLTTKTSKLTSTRTSSIVQFTFFFWSFEISGNILRNQNLLYV